MWCWASCSWNQETLCLWQPKPAPALVWSQPGAGNTSGMRGSSAGMRDFTSRQLFPCLKPKTNPVCLGTQHRGLALLCHTSCDQPHAMVCTHSSSWTLSTALSEQPGSNAGLNRWWWTPKSDWGRKTQVYGCLSCSELCWEHSQAFLELTITSSLLATLCFIHDWHILSAHRTRLAKTIPQYLQISIKAANIAHRPFLWSWTLLIQPQQ